MKPNPYTGDVPVEINGWPKLTLRFDWQALAQMQAQFGERATKLVLHHDVEALLDLTVIGLQRHHPEITRTDFARGGKLEPPAALVPLMEAVTKALAMAYHGPGEGTAGAETAANPQNRAARRARAARKRTASKRR